MPVRVHGDAVQHLPERGVFQLRRRVFRGQAPGGHKAEDVGKGIVFWHGNRGKMVTEASGLAQTAKADKTPGSGNPAPRSAGGGLLVERLLQISNEASVFRRSKRFQRDGTA
ncbi:hypothetical protein KL86DPRO_11591 [uncultured delta proteobacterium]|uniref:Uncharacterized protein n=1 Tax=uncultured delta proteobacterium TaxID=34034 RepID=A0A212JJ36_9DELT|nr:hypothetical protein KL86DPRO_11591 [uncultured delta proteobacterium]